MKKSAFFLGAAAVGAAAFAGVNEVLYRALIYSDFKVPAGVSRLMNGDTPAPSDKQEYSVECKEYLENYGYERHHIINADGNRLTAYLVKPRKQSDVYVFASHGYRSDGRGEWCFFVKHYIEKLGFNLFMVDHQGAGESQGRYAGFGSFESRDGLDWINYMTETFGKDIKIILHGISMGCATVTLMTGSGKLPDNVKFTVADCGYTSALDEFRYKLQCWGVPEKLVVPVISAMNKKRAGYDFQTDTNALEAVSRAKIPMLFIHGDRDKFVPTYMVHRLFDACSAPYKDKLIVEGAGHADSYHLAKEKYEEKIDEFIAIMNSGAEI